MAAMESYLRFTRPWFQAHLNEAFKQDKLCLYYKLYNAFGQMTFRIEAINVQVVWVTDLNYHKTNLFL